MTLTSVITSRSSVIYTRRVRFSHAECHFNTQSVISKRSVILIRTHVISTLTNIIPARTRVITTRTSVISTRIRVI
jgi:hypothetical protein